MTSQNSADAGAPASAASAADQANPAFAAPATAASAAGHTEAPLAQASPTQAGHPAQAEHPNQAGRRRRRVVHLGPKDRERVAEGANLEQVVQEALGKVDAERPAWSREDLRREDPSAHANDARLLGDVPPHYGNGA